MQTELKAFVFLITTLSWFALEFLKGFPLSVTKSLSVYISLDFQQPFLGKKLQ